MYGTSQQPLYSPSSQRQSFHQQQHRQPSFQSTQSLPPHPAQQSSSASTSNMMQHRHHSPQHFQQVPQRSYSTGNVNIPPPRSKGRYIEKKESVYVN